MKVLLITTGSRGDVEPFVCLARGLAAAGHDPILASPKRFERIAAASGVSFVGLDDGLFALQDELANKGTRAAFTGVKRARPAMRRFLYDVAGLADHPADAVVYHPKTLAAPLIAEAKGIPSIAAQLIPLFQPTRVFSAPVTSFTVPRAFNRATWRLISAIEAPWKGMIREVHRRLGLRTPLLSLSKRIADSGALNAWSRFLLPAPADWSPAAQPIGFWRSSTTGAALSETVADFIDAGAPPVYVGFGSMTARNPSQRGEAIRAALRKAGCRGIVARGAGAVELDSTDDVLVVDHAPHDELFQRVAAAVHHGGVGTTAAALTAGIPQIIKPFLGDQHFWARRVSAIRVGVQLREFGASGLSGAIESVGSLRSGARAIAKSIRENDDGIAATVRRIEQLQSD